VEDPGTPPGSSPAAEADRELVMTPPFIRGKPARHLYEHAARLARRASRTHFEADGTDSATGSSSSTSLAGARGMVDRLLLPRAVRARAREHEHALDEAFASKRPNAAALASGRTVSVPSRARRQSNMSEAAQKAILAGGCFWGMQDLFRKQPGVSRRGWGTRAATSRTRPTATTARTPRRSRSSSTPSRRRIADCSSSSSRSTTRRR
jgi:hypothetical protein